MENTAEISKADQNKNKIKRKVTVKVQMKLISDYSEYDDTDGITFGDDSMQFSSDIGNESIFKEKYEEW